MNLNKRLLNKSMSLRILLSSNKVKFQSDRKTLLIISHVYPELIKMMFYPCYQKPNEKNYEDLFGDFIGVSNISVWAFQEYQRLINDFRFNINTDESFDEERLDNNELNIE